LATKLEDFNRALVGLVPPLGVLSKSERRALKERKRASERRESNLIIREQAVEVREEALTFRKQALDTREETLQTREQALDPRERAVDARASDFVAKEAQYHHEIGKRDAELQFYRYAANRYRWQMLALQRELFGPPEPCNTPPREIPADLMARFTMDGQVVIENNYLDGTYPANHPLIYTDAEIETYMGTISGNLQRPENERMIHWSVYGALDQWLCDAIGKYPIRGQSVVNMGSLTPWYEAMFLLFGAVSPCTIDYNRIVLRTSRMRFMTIDEWERDRPIFDVGFSISSFEHDGLGMYGDPLDPDGDFKAMRKMKERIKPGGLLFLAVPTGRDKILFNNARIYGRARLPKLMEGWKWIDSYGFTDADLDGNGSAQPLYVLVNEEPAAKA
jgi:hypothetical protein